MKRFILLCGVLLLFLSCDSDNKNIVEETVVLPLNTAICQISDITFYTAEISGKFDISQETSQQSEFGIYLSTDKDIVFDNSKKYSVIVSSKDYSFTISLSGLDTLTTYYFCSYVFKDGKYIYGDVYNFKTKGSSDVIKTGTLDADSCTITSNIESNNLIKYIERFGLCYGINKNPTIENGNNKYSILGGSTYSLKMDILPYDTIYYRAYVVIGQKVYYGDIKSFEKLMKTSPVVDLGLSVKWATFNVGATSPYEAGYYYAWGNTVPRDTSNYGYSKWEDGYKNNMLILDPEDDVAQVKWRGEWRTPTFEEFKELELNCDVSHTVIDGIDGYIFQSRIEGYTDNYIFLPAFGCYWDKKINYWGNMYMTSSYEYGDDLYGGVIYQFESSSNYNYINSNKYHYHGFWASMGSQVRPVCPSEQYKDMDVTSLSFNKDTVIIRIDSYNNVYYNVKMNDILVYRSIKWDFSDSSIVSINNSINNYNKNGYYLELKGLKTGTTTIKASYNGLQDSCVVIVQGYRYVDLGGSVYWATSNVGANEPWEYGNYYAWAEIETKDTFSMDTYKWYFGSTYYRGGIQVKKITKYCNSPEMSYTNNPDNIYTIEFKDDIARIEGGGNWRMPTREELKWLVDNCRWEGTTNNNVRGYMVYSKTNGNSIFLPAAGYYSGNKKKDVGGACRYWSSGLSNSYDGNQPDCYAISSNGQSIMRIVRWVGLPIRAVRKKN